VKPLDPRLLRVARPARRYVVLTAGLGTLTAALVVVQALLIAHVVAPVVAGAADAASVRPLLAWLALTLAGRCAVAWAQERFGQRAGVDVVATLREQVVDHAVALGPRWLAAGRTSDVATLATRGLDDLQPYLVRYLPQLLLAALVTPATIVVMWGLDPVSALIVIGTLPLVPLFMVLVGRLTQSASERRLASMRRLGSQMLDLLAGLPTLKALGREHGPEARVRALGDGYRRTTMGTLRIAFLSGFVLELLTTLSVAMVAVTVGVRLVDGSMGLTVGLAAIVLAPEVYLPLRQVGAHFHASADGVAAAQAALDVLETPLPVRGSTPAPRMTGGTIEIEDLTVRAADRDLLAPAHLHAVLAPATITALHGPNGSGKSTTVHALLALLVPDGGRVRLRPAHGAPVDLADVDPATWWSQVSWLEQRPRLEPGTVLSNVRERVADDVADGAPRDADASCDPALLEAARLTGLDAVVAGLPHGWSTAVGHGGVGLSVGQRQRVALTAAVLSRRPVVVLDEPTAHLDAASAEAVHATLRALRDAGRTVVVVAHRPELLALCDDVVEVAASSVGRAAEQEVAHAR